MINIMPDKLSGMMKEYFRFYAILLKLQTVA